jgi:C4-dicarboxylate transporter, DctM subunit
MSDVLIGILGLLALLLLFPTGIELGFGMAIVGVVGFALIVSPQAAMNLLAKDFFDVFSSYGFTVIPLFILMGQVAFNAGIARRLYAAAYRFVGHIPGGLAMATVVGATVFKAICGSSPPRPRRSPAWPCRRWTAIATTASSRPASWRRSARSAS